MKILIACEESQVVCKAFRDKGHEAYSCDLYETSGQHPEWHITGDVVKVLAEPWDMIIAFPPCTYLTIANNRHMAHGCSKYTIEEGKLLREDGKAFFMLFVNHPCKKKSIENPVGIMSTQYMKPTQVVHPWQYGHRELKPTCLWLTGLPALKPTNIITPPKKMTMEDRRIWQKVHRMSPGPERAKLRSKTYQGIADAMADQWG